MNGLHRTDLEVRIRQQPEVEIETVMLPQQRPTALPSAGEITKDRKRELLKGRVGLDDALQQRYYASLRRFFLPRLVPPAEIEARLEDMIGDFLL